MVNEPSFSEVKKAFGDIEGRTVKIY